MVFSFMRRLIVDGSFSEGMSTVTAIVAGSTFSCAILHIVLIWPSDKLLQLWPQVSLSKYVDDLGLRVTGRLEDVAVDVVQVFDDLLALVEEPLDLEVSRGSPGHPGGKTIALASHASLRARIQGPLRQRGVAIEGRARYLGVDHRGAGKQKGSSVRTKRARMLALRAKKLMGLKRSGGQVAKVAKTGLKPAALYGTKCLGLAPRHVKQLRTVTSACLPGKHIGRSMMLRLVPIEPTRCTIAGPRLCALGRLRCGMIPHQPQCWLKLGAGSRWSWGWRRHGPK